jgi:hypothetical protein
VSLLLQHLHAMGSGSRRLFEMTDTSRSRLISMGRQMDSTSLGAVRATPDSSSQDTFQNWLEWVRREQVKRLVWFSFVSLSIATKVTFEPSRQNLSRRFGNAD